jgi:hypothetical protein
LLEEVGDQDEEVWRDGVALEESLSALDPFPRDVVLDNRSVAGGVEDSSPLAPSVRNPLGSEDGFQGRQSHRVEGFGEVQLEGDDYNSSFVAGLHNPSGVEEVFGDAPTLHEARLVAVDEQQDQRLETQAHAFGAELGNAILEGDRAVVLGPDGPLFLGQEDEVGLVDAS